jgi:regulatory protein SWI5
MTPAITPLKESSENARHSPNMQCLQTKNSMNPNVTHAASMQRTKSLQGVPGSTFTQAKVVDVPSPSHTVSSDVEAFETFDFQESDSTGFSKICQNTAFESTVIRDAKPESQSSSVSGSFHSSPEFANIPLPAKNSRPTLKVPIEPATPISVSPRKASDSTPASPIKTKLSPRVASIDNLNLDSRIQASITATGVTIEEIASYISGPDPEDSKWVCLHPGCNRRFGRKENIKSHIQTHLGDRQYKCDHCDKCFVRGHDLKRHAKIHTGDKPYECLCGNVFARHDALTRHKQRGMCIGGYKGVVRKTTKRGRPRKHRPDMEESQNKSFRTRERVAARSIASSVSGSDNSAGSPPTEVFESMSIHGSSPLECAIMFQPSTHGLPLDAFTFTPPASPRHSTRNMPSSPRSYRSLSPGTEDETLIVSLSRQPLAKITEEFPDLPPISEAGACFENDHTAITAAALSSPHIVPTLIGSSTESDIDIFLSQDSTPSFGKTLNGSDMTGFVEFGTESSFAGEFDIFQEKGVMSDDFFLQFHGEEQQIDAFLKSFP